MSSTTGPSEVLSAREGALGHITLNRPEAINSLTLGMIRGVSAALDRFEQDSEVRCVVIDGAGRGLSAGGDVVAIRAAILAGDNAAAETFWREEYVLDARIARYAKPLIPLMDGVVMGGGVGISAHVSRYRVATERLMLAMPEVGIGLHPDVGGSYLLSRAPGELGTHLALTGGRIGVADAQLCGLVDHVVASDWTSMLISALSEVRAEEDVLALLTSAPAPNETPTGDLASARRWIDAAYASDSLEEIIARLRARPEAEARQAAETIATKSPTSLKVTLRGLREARELPTLEACLDQEFRMSLTIAHSADFSEGVRAVLVDKDREPRWKPATPEMIDTATLDQFFAPLVGISELGLAAAA